LPDGIFLYKNPTMGKFWRALERKMLVCCMTLLSVLRPFNQF
jgi:hypothetical protein